LCYQASIFTTTNWSSVEWPAEQRSDFSEAWSCGGEERPAAPGEAEAKEHFVEVFKASESAFCTGDVRPGDQGVDVGGGGQTAILGAAERVWQGIVKSSKQLPSPAEQSRVFDENGRLRSKGEVRREVVKLLADIKGDSFPGVPYSLLGSTNDDVLKEASGLIVDIVVERLFWLARVDWKEMMDQDFVLRSVLRGWLDPVRVFVKREPHKIQKIQTGRLRLIWAYSLAMQLVERVLGQEFNKQCIQAWAMLPVKPGMGASDEAFRLIYAHLEHISRRGGGLSHNDIGGWDLSVKRWMQIAEAYIDLNCTPWSVASDWFRARLNVNLAATNAIAVLSDGTWYRMRVPGRQVSGRYFTSSGNSKMRLLLGTLRGVELMAMGDDCAEELGDGEAKRFYSSLGFRVEGTSVPSPVGAVFCSCRYLGPGVAIPENWDRTFFRLMSKKVIGFAEFVQFADEIRHLPSQERDPLLRQIALCVEEMRVLMLREEQHECPEGDSCA